MTSRAGSLFSSPSWGALRSPRWHWWPGRRQPETGPHDSPEHATNSADGIHLTSDEHHGEGFQRIRDNGTLRFRPGAGGFVLRCHSGTLVVTQEGDPLDHVLGPRDEFRTKSRGLVVAWALSDGSVTAYPARTRNR